MSEKLEMTCCSLYSGSSGNAFYVAYGDTKILIDCGKSGKQTIEALQYIGVKPEELSAILITHEHTDHITGAGVMSRKFHIPVYANEKTWEAIGEKIGKFERGMQRTFERNADFYLGSLGVVPFAISHDAADPCGFRLYAGSASIATATDLGYLSQENLRVIEGSDLILLESNHEPDLVEQNEHYSRSLKDRILGRKGHLSNKACANAMVQLVEAGTRYFILGHLSSENNRPELAMQTSVARAELEGWTLDEDVHLDLAWRERVGNVYSLEARHAWRKEA